MPELLKRMNVSVKNPDSNAPEGEEWLPLGLMGADLDKAKQIVDNLTQSLPQDWDEIAYKDMLTPYTQESMVATRVYTIGQYICVGKKLYKTTAAIAVGTTLSINSNVKETTLSGDVGDLKTQLNESLESSLIPISVDYTWTTGGIGSTTGDNNDTMTNRKRTNRYYSYGDYPILKYAVPDGWELGIFVYDWISVSEHPYIGWSRWLSGSGHYNVNTNQHYRLMVRATDNHDLSNEDIPSDLIVDTCRFTDTTLTLNNKAADAKATGDSITKNKKFERTILPTLYGDKFKWRCGRYLQLSGEITESNDKMAVSEPVSVQPGTVIINESSATVDSDIDAFMRYGLYNGDDFVERTNIITKGEEYIIPNGVNKIRFVYGSSISSSAARITPEIIAKYFAIKILVPAKQDTSFIDEEKPLYVALGASTSWGAVHHPDSVITQTDYQYPIMVGDKLGLKTINLSKGSTGFIARSNNPGNDPFPINASAFNNGYNNYMDLVLDNNEYLSRASLITLMFGYGNDADAGLPIGNYNDYYPFDEPGYRINTSTGVADMITKGATLFGCLNWIIKYISEHYPTAQLILIYGAMSFNGTTRTATINETELGSGRYSITFGSDAGSYNTINTRLKTLMEYLKTPLINMFEESFPFNYYNSNVIENGEYVLFSTTSGGAKNNHPSDIGYKMVGRFLTGRIASLFY